MPNHRPRLSQPLPEPVGEGTPPRPPTSPAAFLWLFIRRRFIGRTILLNLTAAGGIGLMGMEPVALRALVDGLAAGNGAAGNGGGGWSGTVLFWFVALGGLWIGSALFNRLRELTEIHTMPALRHDIQAHLFAYLIGHSPRYFQENFAGNLGQKVKQAGQSAVQLLGLLTNDVIRILIILGIGIALLFAAHPLFAVLLVGWTVAHLTLSAFLARHCLTLSRAFSEEVSVSTGRMVDAVANAELVRAFSRKAHERGLLADVLAGEVRRSKALRRFLMLQGLFLFTALLVFQITLLGIAIAQAAEGRMSVGDFAMVFSLAGIIGTNVWGLSTRMLELFEQLGILSGALALIGQPHEIADRPDAVPLDVRGGAIKVRGLHFAHADGSTVFQGLDFRVAPGERVALVGPSGAGKSTLVRLLRRQYVHQSGRILIDGQDIAGVTLDSLNRAIAEVPQSPGLFHRTIRENIAYARPGAGEADIVEAACKAHCHDFITRRAEGYDTVVGEQGVLLSGGERQRIAVARAFLKDAPILVLDEATASLDSETERLIQDALWQLFEGRTVIAIAHRLSTIAGMDRIVYLEHGRILEEGRHADLLARDGHYARLWNCQVGGFLP